MQRECRRQPADAAACDQDLHRLLPCPSWVAALAQFQADLLLGWSCTLDPSQEKFTAEHAEKRHVGKCPARAVPSLLNSAHSAVDLAVSRSIRFPGRLGLLARPGSAD